MGRGFKTDYMADYDNNGGVLSPRKEFIPIALRAMDAQPRQDPIEAMRLGRALVAASGKPQNL